MQLQCSPTLNRPVLTDRNTPCYYVGLPIRGLVSRIRIILAVLAMLPAAGWAQMPTWWGKAGATVTTCRADADADHVMMIMDTRNATTAPFALDWAPTMYADPSWSRSNLGQVYGIALDASNNIYVAATMAYGTPNAYNSSTLVGTYGSGGSGAIYKIDATTGAITTFCVIPQDQTVMAYDTTGSSGNPTTLAAITDKDSARVGAGLGNICYDAEHNQFFATSFDDGKIYRINSAGSIQDTFDPQTLDQFIADPSPTDTGNNDLISPLGDRVWGVGYYGGRVYFSAWKEDRRPNNPAPSSTIHNAIYSVALSGSGAFTGTERLEVTMADFAKDGASPGITSNPVADIEFDLAGNMLVGERGMGSDLDPSAHRSSAFYFARSGGGTYTSLATYGTTPGYIRVGTSPSNDNGSASGGVDFGYDNYDSGTQQASGNLTKAWATGHRLRETGDDSGPGGSGYIIAGAQLSPVSGFADPALFYATSYFVDYDGATDRVEKTEQGDIDAIRALPAATCSITDVAVTAGACNDNGTPLNATDDYYTADVTVTFSDAPTTGTLDLSGVALHSTNSVSSVAVGSLSSSTSHTFTGVRLKADNVANSLTATFSADTNCTLTVNPTAVPPCSACPTINVTPSPLSSGTVGTAYTGSPSASGGSTPYAWTATGLPAGLSLNASTGAITGTPTASGAATITATDANGCAGTTSLTINPFACPTITVTPAILPEASVGQPYSETPTASGAGGGASYGWSATSLPAGLSINPTTGLISGTPTAEGTATITATYTGPGGELCTGTATLSIVNNCCPQLIFAVP